MLYYRRLLNDLVRSFRTCGPERLEYLLSVIRSSESLDEIGMALDADINLDEDPSSRASEELEKTRTGVSRSPDSPGGQPSKRRRVVMSIQSLSDEPLFDLPASPWTTITDDDHFVSHLVSLYFTWEHAACHLIDRELFLEDMKSAQLGSQSCSPFLVNALLATACVSYISIFGAYPSLLTYGSLSQTTPKHARYLEIRRPGVINFTLRQSDYGTRNKVPTASPMSRHCV